MISQDRILLDNNDLLGKFRISHYLHVDSRPNVGNSTGTNDACITSTVTGGVNRVASAFKRIVTADRPGQHFVHPAGELSMTVHGNQRGNA